MKFPHLFAVALTLDMAFQVRQIRGDALRQAQNAKSVQEGFKIIQADSPLWKPFVTLDDDQPIFDRGLIKITLPYQPVTIQLDASEDPHTHELQFYAVAMFNHVSGEHYIEAKFDSGSTMMGWWPKEEHGPVTGRVILFLDNLIATADGIHPHSLTQLKALSYMLRAPSTS